MRAYARHMRAQAEAVAEAKIAHADWPFLTIAFATAGRPSCWTARGAQVGQFGCPTCDFGQDCEGANEARLPRPAMAPTPAIEPCDRQRSERNALLECRSRENRKVAVPWRFQRERGTYYSKGSSPPSVSARSLFSKPRGRRLPSSSSSSNQSPSSSMEKASAPCVTYAPASPNPATATLQTMSLANVLQPLNMCGSNGEISGVHVPAATKHALATESATVITSAMRTAACPGVAVRSGRCEATNGAGESTTRADDAAPRTVSMAARA